MKTFWKFLTEIKQDIEIESDENLRSILSRLSENQLLEFIQYIVNDIKDIDQSMANEPVPGNHLEPNYGIIRAARYAQRVMRAAARLLAAANDINLHGDGYNLDWLYQMGYNLDRIYQMAQHAAEANDSLDNSNYDKKLNEYYNYAISLLWKAGNSAPGYQPDSNTDRFDLTDESITPEDLAVFFDTLEDKGRKLIVSTPNYLVLNLQPFFIRGDSYLDIAEKIFANSAKKFILKEISRLYQTPK